LLGGDYMKTLLWTLYGLVFEAVWSLPFYGLLATMFLMHRFVEPRLRHTLFGHGVVEVVTVVLFNLFYLGLLLFYQAVLNHHAITWHPVFLYYLLMDLIGAVIV